MLRGEGAGSAVASRRLGVEQRGPGKNCLHDHGISPARLKSMRAVLSTGMRKYVSLQYGRVIKHIRVSQ
ncbi:RIKEN cDNA A330041J22 [Mus musculus]|nr:RIKEN cDNA A330041J22 [Mus musculus]